MTSALSDIDINSLSPAEINAMLGDWDFWRRESQKPPAIDYFLWLILTGRGFGKTRTGAETVREWAKNRNEMIVVAGRTYADTRDILIIGESGILEVCKYDFGKPEYNESKRKINFPKTNSAVTILNGETPDGFRGINCSKFWFDEFCFWKNPQKAWDTFIPGARKGNVQGIITTTPFPIPILKEFVKDAKTPEITKTFVTRGSTYDNAANLSPMALQQLKRRYEGTRIGRQELYGEILDDNPNALWQYSNLDKHRLSAIPETAKIQYVRVGVDPSNSNNEDSCKMGIITNMVDDAGHVYVVSDDTIAGASPEERAKQVVNAYRKYMANEAIVEVNNGGDWIPALIRNVDPSIRVVSVRASHGKITRAEPVAQLYEQGRVHHVGNFPELESEMCEFQPGMESPDRMDALVWGITPVVEKIERIWRL